MVVAQIVDLNYLSKSSNIWVVFVQDSLSISRKYSRVLSHKSMIVFLIALRAYSMLVSTF